MKRRKFVEKRLLPVLFSLGLTFNASAVKVHINSGNPAYPFPQFLEYSYGDGHKLGNLGTKLAPGLTHAEMEQQLRDAYQLHANEFEYTGDEWAGIKYIETPFKSAYDCTEGDGYALLAAAYMADKTTFDGYWMCMHDKRRARSKKYSDCTPTYADYEYGPFSLIDYSGSATDGDEDVALALYVAYKQWGEFMLDEKGEKVLDACGNPISYKQELIEVLRGLVALNTRFPLETKLMRVNTGMIGLDGYVKGGDTWTEATVWAEKNPTVLTDSASIFSYPFHTLEEGTVNVKDVPLVPEFSSSFRQHIDYNAPAYYREFHDLLLSLSKELGATNAWEAEQFRRAEASSDWLIGQLLGKSPYAVPIAGTYEVNEDGSETTFSNSNVGEDFRTPWRNISNYVWHGNPSYTWNPVTHKVDEGGNTFQYDAAHRLSAFLHDPMHWNDSLETSCYEYGSCGYSVSGPKTMQWQVNSLTGEQNAGNDLLYISIGLPKATSTFAAIGEQDYDLMGELYNIVYSLFDVRGTTPEGEPVPMYFHGWFRQLGLMALTGNYAAPSQMEAGSNLKIYRSVKDSVSSCRVGDTITYQLSFRNYGSKAATGVVIAENVPNGFAFIGADNKGVYDASTHTIQWALGEVPGFKSDGSEGAALDLTAPNLAKTMGTVSYKCVVLPGASGKYSPVATIKSDNGKESQTDEYPNFVTATMQRNSIDILPNALSVVKAADKDSLAMNDMVKFTVSFANTDSLPFLTGGRPGVNFSVAGEPHDRDEYEIKCRLNNDAVEPFINTGNYRFTYYTDTVDLQITPLNVEGVSKDINNGFSEVQLPSGIRANRLQLGNGLSSNSVLLSWEPPHIRNDLKGGFPVRMLFRLWYNGFLNFNPSDGSYTISEYDFSKMWSQFEKAADEDLYYPVSPSFQNPNVVMTVDKVINSECDVTDKVAETVLVEEFDGHTWRKILGNAPYNGIEAEEVVVTDTIPLGFEFAFLSGDSSNVKYTRAASGAAYAGTVTYSTDKLGIGEKGNFSYVCRFVGSTAASIKSSTSIADKVEKVTSEPYEMVVMSQTTVDKAAANADALVDVYNPQGILLKKQVSNNQALNGLKRGVYVVGNQKKVVTK
ncbi:MAG: DUF11 domain-containing protein [Paludibacteraceae bacterium]|nr:DUF11 domain-containing protein [Paludibacteraceae bacterium]